MRHQLELSANPARECCARASAFGLSLDIDRGIDIPGISYRDAHDVYDLGETARGCSACADISRPPTRVRLDPQELSLRWRRARSSGCGNQRRNGGAALSVEFVPGAGFLLHAEGFARIMIALDGTEVICDPESESSDWTAFLVAQALPLAATLCGLEVLHASGVVLGSRAILFSGSSGVGKSSLAAALVRRGASLFSDDAVAVKLCDGVLIGYPGPARLNLRATEHARLSTRERALLGSSTMLLGKHSFGPSVNDIPVQLSDLFLVEHATNGAPVERIDAVDPLALFATTYILSIQTPERLARHLDLTCALAATASIHRLRVRPDMNATQLADAVHDYLLELSS